MIVARAVSIPTVIPAKAGIQTVMPVCGEPSPHSGVNAALTTVRGELVEP